MSVLITIAIVLLVLGLALYGVGLLPIDYKLGNLLRFALVVIAVAYLLLAVGIVTP